MPLKILIVPDKFKGTLTAGEAARAIARGWREARPHDGFDLLPMSDGGDGFGEVIGNLVGARSLSVKTIDAAHRPCKSRWWWEAKSKTAVIESANVVGLAMLPEGKFHPFELDTFGLGEVVRAAASKGAKRCIIGIGGSATNDGGFGLARSLGWRFLDRDGHAINRWTELHRLAGARAPRKQSWFDELIVAVDVQNSLLGMRGATRVYGPQKGLRTFDLEPAGRALRGLARAVQKYSGKNLSRVPGTGAAGGLGFGLLAFLGGRLESGFDLFARLSNLDQRLRSVDLVITGEGKLDESTLMGKGTGEIAWRCRKLKTPCLGLAGEISGRNGILRFFTTMHALTDLISLDRAKSNPEIFLGQLTRRVAADWPSSSGIQRLRPDP
jgi:glycerate 2-kinase